MRRRPHSNPLNPFLYERLWEVFDGDVLVANAGQRLQYRIDKRYGKSVISKVSGCGSEEYMVNCPLCGDKRNRCYVNHSFGAIIKGVMVRHFVHCFNEECTGLSAWFMELLQEEGRTKRVVISPVESSEVIDIEKVAAQSASNYMRFNDIRLLDGLPQDHPAVAYAVQRGFSPAYLAKFFNVGYSATGGFPFQRRLVAPVVYHGMQVGWSGRAIPDHTTIRHPNQEPPREAKYLNSPGMPKSHFVYNLDAASQFDVMAIAEGITDVWKIGVWGAALMGKTMSESQCRQLCEAGARRKAWIVLLGDASTARDDAASAWRVNHEKLARAYRYPERVRLHLFDHGDPGDRSSQELNDLVRAILDKR